MQSPVPQTAAQPSRGCPPSLLRYSFMVVLACSAPHVHLYNTQLSPPLRPLTQPKSGWAGEHSYRQLGQEVFPFWNHCRRQREWNACCPSHGSVLSLSPVAKAPKQIAHSVTASAGLAVLTSWRCVGRLINCAHGTTTIFCRQEEVSNEDTRSELFQGNSPGCRLPEPCVRARAMPAFQHLRVLAARALHSDLQWAASAAVAAVGGTAPADVGIAAAAALQIARPQWRPRRWTWNPTAVTRVQ